MDTRTATRTQVWRHQGSGDLYAVELGGGDTMNVARAWGPVAEDQAKQITAGSTTPDNLGLIEETEFVQNKAGEFEPFEGGT